ncbi:hypothetical protein [Tsukamurella ocularis]|uniref:hypothetical protein n=1 Tax=Tsukamurella ocularis TaxID=1970234 RepID=UPI00216889C7|nr:hypothetical protein [Tsukamurella ocularis]MCS3853345.1 hypothetical protein [Tsukamurella ocularis]
MSDAPKETLIEDELARIREGLTTAVTELVDSQDALGAVKAREAALAAELKALADERTKAEKRYSAARASAKGAGVSSDTLRKFPAVPGTGKGKTGAAAGKGSSPAASKKQARSSVAAVSAADAPADEQSTTAHAEAIAS